jgi:protein TonB
MALDRAPVALLLAGAALLSAAAHLGGMGLASRMRRGAPPRPPAPAQIRVAVVEKPAPPAAASAPDLAPPAVPERPRRRQPRPEAPRPPTPPPEAAPATEKEPGPPGPEPPVLVPGLSLSATTTGGTLGVKPGSGPGAPGRPTDDGGESGGRGPVSFVPGYALTEEPVFLDNVSPAQVRRFYPEEARKARIEGVVVAKLAVDDLGKVIRVKVIDDPGHGFGEAAARLARLYRFKPAKVDGKAVATEIQFTIRFELE